MAMLERGRRSTCGTRMTELIGEAAEMDKTFWDSAVWAEGDDDSENDSFDEEEEEVKPDEFDSDFNDTETDESDEDEDGQIKAQQRRERTAATKTSTAYKEPVKPTRPRPTTSSSSSAVKKRPLDTDTAELSVKLRRSTSDSTARAKELLTVRALAPGRAPRRPLPKREFSQRDLLLEALSTEVDNFKWLKSQQMAEEERNRQESKSVKVSRRVARSLLSRAGGNSITFVDDSSWPSVFNPAGGFSSCPGPERDPSQLVCAVTGLTAKYKDPMTGLPYHDAAAFKILREKNKKTLALRRSVSAPAATSTTTPSHALSSPAGESPRVSKKVVTALKKGKDRGSQDEKAHKKRGRKVKAKVQPIGPPLQTGVPLSYTHTDMDTGNSGGVSGSSSNCAAATAAAVVVVEAEAEAVAGDSIALANAYFSSK